MNTNKIEPHGRTLYADSVLNRIVTAYPCATDSTPYSYPDGTPARFNLGKILLSRPPMELEALQAEIRAEADPDRRAALKRCMMAFTPAAFVAPYRKASNVQHLTDLMPADIDYKDNADRLLNYDDLKAEISKLPYVAYCGRSLSGTGFWVLFFIGHNITIDEYKAAFEQLRRDFLPMGIVIDPAPSNPSSLRFYSYDEDAYVNHYPQAYTRRYIPAPAPKPTAKAYTATTTQMGQMSQSIIEVFNASNDICTMIEYYRFHGAARDGEGVRYVRHGKQSGKSAWALPAKNIVYIWTSSTDLDPNKWYNPFTLFAHMEHGGDYKAAVRALKAAGVQ